VRLKDIFEMSVASSNDAMTGVCSPTEIDNLIHLGLSAGPIRRMTCLKCVIKGAELFSKLDAADRNVEISRLKKEIDKETEQLQSAMQQIEFIDMQIDQVAPTGNVDEMGDLVTRRDEIEEFKTVILETLRDFKDQLSIMEGAKQRDTQPSKLLIALYKLDAYLGTSVKDVTVEPLVAESLLNTLLFYASAGIETSEIVDLTFRSPTSHALSTISGYFFGLAEAEKAGSKMNQDKTYMWYNTGELSAESEMIPPLRILNYLSQAGLQPIFVGELFGMHISSDVRKIVDVWVNTNLRKEPVSPDQILSLYLKPRPFTLLNVQPISFNSFLEREDSDSLPKKVVEDEEARRVTQDMVYDAEEDSGALI